MDPLSDFNKNHPELCEGEIFLANCSESDFRCMNWQTKRCGEIAYDSHGNRSSLIGFRPVFIMKKEIEDLGRAGIQFSMHGPPKLME